MLILSIESSCDETSAAVVELDDRGEGSVPVRRILSNEIASQTETHKLYGGVVPEIASRAHTEAIASLTAAALSAAGCGAARLDAVAVTAYPGLIGALLVGVNFAKALAYANSKPLVAVDHIRGHIAANYFAHPALRPPFLALVVSGGHTSLIDVRGYTEFVTVGSTRDDAAGEAFDKVARLLGIPYPGGRELDELASRGDAGAIAFPSAAIAGDNLDFSFSGLKTSVMNFINRAEMTKTAFRREDVAASFVRDAVESLSLKTAAAYRLVCRNAEDGRREPPRALVAAGGVSANSHLRASLTALAERLGVPLCLPPLSLCGDNAAMIGAQAYYEYLAGNVASLDLNASAEAGA